MNLPWWPLVVVGAVSGSACSASHSLDDDAGTDAAGITDGGSHADGSTDRDALSDGGLPAMACSLSCSVTPLASGYVPRDATPAMSNEVEILASVVAPSGAVHALLAPGPGAAGPAGRRWVLATADPGARSFDIGDDRTWPRSPGAGSLDGAGNSLDAAILRATDSVIEAVVLFTVREATGLSPMDVRVGHLAWSPGGALVHAADVGPIVTLSAPAYPRGTIFELPDGNVIAAAEHNGVIAGARLAWTGAGDAPEIVEHLTFGVSGDGDGGMAPLSGVALDDTRWWFAGGGHSITDSRPAFASAIVDDAVVWTGPLRGGLADPPPLLALSGTAAMALRWQQDPSDIDDATLVATRLTEFAEGERFAVPTPRLPMPRDAVAANFGSGAFAVWSVRAPDDLDDTTVHVVLLDQTTACPATEALPIVRFRGAASAPSVHAIGAGDDFLVLGLPIGPSGNHELTALRASCIVHPE